MSKEKLDQLIKKSNGYITAKESVKYGVHRQYLSMYVQENKLEKVAPGVYQTPLSWNDGLYQLQSNKKKMIYSHETALYLHGLSDREPERVSITLPTGYRTTSYKDLNVQTFTMNAGLFEEGVQTITTVFGNTVKVYNKERTLCDIVRSRSKIEANVIIQAFKLYFLNPDYNVSLLMKYATLLRVKKQVQPFIEILL